MAGLLERVRACARCELAASRTNIVFGSGSASAKLMFVGEAPGYHEDQQGVPFVGRAGQLLSKLLGRIGLTRDDVYIANVLKCRPPENRDPLAEEISLCRKFLEEQVAIISPIAVCTMGNFATKLLSGKPDGITRVRGAAQPMPGAGEVLLFPVFHPAAALYTPANLATLEKDFDTLGGIIGATKPGPEQEAAVPESQVAVETEAQVMAKVPGAQEEPEQLGLF